MLLVLLSLALAAPVTAISSPFLARQVSEVPCALACAVPYALFFSCLNTTNPYCGCTESLTEDSGCKTCLVNTSTTLYPYFDATAISAFAALCNCRISACGSLISATKQCYIKYPTDPAYLNCSCPSVATYGAECYACMGTKEPTLVGFWHKNLLQCQALVSGNVSASTATAAGTAHPTSTPSATSTGGSVITSPPGVVVGLVVAAAAIVGML
jgi:hypothetical protein